MRKLSISESAMVDEIPFVCSLFLDGGSVEVSVMYGWGCNLEFDVLWKPKNIATANLYDWITTSLQCGVYEPGNSDIFIEDRELLKTKLCHEADIHITTEAATIIEKCALRWLPRGYRIVRSDKVPASHDSWRETKSVKDTTAGL